MIIDNVSNAKRYYASLPLLKKGFDKLTELENAPCGKAEIDGENIYASVQECVSAEPEKCAFENHRRYIDVHYVIDGEERIDYLPKSVCEPTTDFDTENDYELLTANGEFQTVVLNKGDFAVLYPDEVHRTKVCVAEPKPLRKIVFKVEY